MDASNAEVRDYYLLPTTALALSKDQKLRICARVFAEAYRHDNSMRSTRRALATERYLGENHKEFRRLGPRHRRLAPDCFGGHRRFRRLERIVGRHLESRFCCVASWYGVSSG